MQLTTNRAELRKLKRKHARSYQKVDAQLQPLHTDGPTDGTDRAHSYSNLELQTVRGGKGKRLNTKSRMALAIRRNMSNVAASDLGAVLLFDISHQTVCKYEIELGATLVMESRRFHQRHEALFAQSVEPGSWQLACHVIRSDATNSGIWQRCKLQAADAASLYVQCPAGAESLDDVEFHWHHTWCELHRVTDSTAVGFLDSQQLHCNIVVVIIYCERQCYTACFMPVPVCHCVCLCATRAPVPGLQASIATSSAMRFYNSLCVVVCCACVEVCWMGCLFS